MHSRAPGCPRAAPRHTACHRQEPPHTEHPACRAARTRRRSEITSEGKRITRLDSILLNGNNVALVRPPACPHAPAFPPPSPASARPWLTSHHARVKSGRRQRCDPYPNRARGSSCLAATRTTLRSRCYVRTLRSPTFHFEFANVSCALFLIQQILALPSRYRTLARTSSGVRF